jgi:hypothetical protein
VCVKHTEPTGPTIVPCPNITADGTTDPALAHLVDCAVCEVDPNAPTPLPYCKQCKSGAEMFSGACTKPETCTLA